MTRGMVAKRGLATLLVLSGGLTGCRDLVFEDGHRLSDDHVLAGRSEAEGGSALTTAERAQRWFVSTDAGLDKLEEDLRTRLNLTVSLRSTLEAYASGQTKVRDPRSESPTLTSQTSTLASPVVAPVDIAEVLRKDANNPGELDALCAHPLLKTYIGDGCKGLGELNDVPMDNLTIGVDAPNISVSWDAPRQVVKSLRPTDPSGSCSDDGSGGLKVACKAGFGCPTNATGQAIAGNCVWSKPCTSDANCIDAECAAWGGCTSDDGFTAGVCNATTGMCGRYIDFDTALSDVSPTAPVVRVRVPFELSLDPNDALGALIVVNLKSLVVDFRLQPQVCADSGCRTYGRMAFEDYLATSDVVFSTSAVDVRARSAGISYDYEIVPTPLCFLPGVEGVLQPLFPVPAGAAPLTCVLIATTVLPPLLNDALPRAGNRMGPLVETLLNPRPIAIPTSSLPSWLSIPTHRVFYTTTDGRTLPLAGLNGAWTDDTIDIVANGASHAFIRVNLNDTPVADTCADFATQQCEDLCGGRPSPCDLSNAKVCLRFHGESTPCDGGLRLLPREFRDIMEIVRSLSDTGTPTDEEIDGMIAQISNATAPIPAAPQLATLLDTSPFVAKTFQSLFTKPLEDAFDDIAEYTDIVFCPATGPRPAACPSGINGPVFRFRVDTDHDGIEDSADHCPTDADAENENPDGDTWCNGSDFCPWTPSIVNQRQYCECDVDHDGCNNELLGDPIPGAPSNVPWFCALGPGNIWDQNPTISDGGENIDGDAATNDCDFDDDADTVWDEDDNCPAIANKDQADQNKDGYGNACDPLCSGPSSCIEPEHHDPSVLPMAMIDWDFGARLIPGCLADGPGCWGFFRVGCASYGPGSSCIGGSEVLRWLAPNGAMGSLGKLTSDITSLSALGDLTKDGVPDFVVTSTGLKGSFLSAIDGATGQALWDGSAGFVKPGSSIAVGKTFIALGAPDHGSSGAIQLISLDGKPLGAPIVGPNSGEKFGTSVTVTGGMLLVGAPGKANGQNGFGGRLYAVTPSGKQPLFLLDGHEVKARIGDVAPVASSYAGSDVLLVPSGDRVLVVERVGQKYGKLGKVLTELSTNDGSQSAQPVSLSAPADFDGDGVREVAIGIPGYSKSAGTIGFLSEDGKLRSGGITTKSGTRFGESVVALGDLDGDGASELGVSIPGLQVPGAPYPGSFVVLTRLEPTKAFQKP